MSALTFLEELKSVSSHSTKLGANVFACLKTSRKREYSLDQFEKHEAYYHSE